MPRDPFSIRTPSFRAKINQLRGVAADEKALLVRVANVIDVFTLTQKQSSNPRSRRRIFSTSIPAPTNVTITSITGGIQISWDPVSIPIDFYEVEISNSASFATSETFQVIGSTRMSFRAPPGADTLFVRIRTVSKKGEVSSFTNTVSISVIDASIFTADQDKIEPENRTSVSPKPTLLGSTFTVTGVGEKLFLGVGGYIGPSPLTLNNNNNGYSANIDKRHEVSYTAFDESDPYPGYEQRLAPTIGEYIDIDDFYTYSPSFYVRFAILPNTISDFFNEINLENDPSTVDIEFLRYRLIGNFYNPNFNQTGITLSATLGAIKF